METSINSAICKGYFQQIRFLIDLDYDVNERDAKDGRTPLINCAFVEDESWGVGLARNLLEHGSLVRLRDCWGLNAMHYACIFNRVELAKVFLNAIDFDLKQGDKQGNTALHYAVAGNYRALTKVLIDAHVKYKVTVDKGNLRGVTPLLEAYRNEHLDCANLLVDLGGADDIAPEVVEFKLSKQCKSLSTSSSSSLGTITLEGENLRPMTSRVRTNNYNRVRSAPLLKKRRRSLTSSSSSSILSEANQNQADNENDVGLMSLFARRDKLVDKMYRTANVNNLHNRPDYLLQMSPIEYFTRRQEQQHHHVTRPMTSASGDVRLGNAFCWRGEMKRLYTTFDFQFTNSYRKSAKPRPEILFDGATMVSTTESPARPISPNPSECLSDSTGASRRSHRRGSFQKTSLDVKRIAKIATNLQNRRPSLLSPKGGLLHSDSSSNESVNSTLKKRSSLEGKDEMLADFTRQGHGQSEKSDNSSRPKSSGKSRSPAGKSSAKNKTVVAASASAGTEDSTGSGEQLQRPHSRTGHYLTPAAGKDTGTTADTLLLQIIKE